MSLYGSDDDDNVFSDLPDDDDWGDEFGGTQRSGAKMVIGFIAVAVLLIIIAVIAFWGYNRTAPDYAAQEWFDSFWTLDGETTLDRTCDAEIWVSNAVNTGASVRGLVDFIGVTEIPYLDELVLSFDLSELSDQFEVDSSRINYEIVSVDEDSAVVSVYGQLRFRAFGGWYPYRLDEDWQIIKEDGRWKWCGLSTTVQEEATE